MGGPIEGDGIRVGIEIHQQLLSPRKLFCECPIRRSDELPFSFTRRLRPAQSELGKTDPAALFEYSKGKVNRYLWSPESACLVDADEEPPHLMGSEAFESALLIALTLGSHPVDEAHVMRKIVIDGSNTAGFQRTAVVGLGGTMVVGGVEVGVQSVTVEEDAARILGETPEERQFSLDRLGVPLVEVALDPVTGDPSFVGEVALHLGRILRSTGRVARGLGTIRQDLNVSSPGGKVVEVKGVQKLNLVPKVVAYEARRQRGLNLVAEKIRERGIREVECKTKEVTALLRDTPSKVLRRRAERGEVIFCICAKGLGGLLGWEPSPGIRLGKELAEVARANSLGGVVHSDEFGAQGVSGEEASVLRAEMGAGEGDGLVLLAGPPLVVSRALGPVTRRLVYAPRGAPAETRAATESGETKYMRPRPGSERMYPETDIPDLLVGPGVLARLRRDLPAHWEAAVDRLARKYSISRELALKVYDSDVLGTFEELSVSLGLDPSVIATTLVETPTWLAREGVPEDALSPGVLAGALTAVAAGKAAKEAIPDILRHVGEKGVTVAEAIDSLGIRAAPEGEIRSVVDSVIAGHQELVEARGEGAFSALMGEAMARLRGRADGARVGNILRDALAKRGRKRPGAPRNQEK